MWGSRLSEEESHSHTRIQDVLMMTLNTGVIYNSRFYVLGTASSKNTLQGTLGIVKEHKYRSRVNTFGTDVRLSDPK